MIKMNKYAIVTGASRGIGKAVAIKLAQLGYDLALIARDKDSLNAVKDQILTETQCQATCYSVDISARKQVEATVAEIMKQHETIELLFNCAGIACKGSSDIEPEKFESMMKVNLLGSFYMIQAITPCMKKQKGGYIINLASLSGKRANSMIGAYAASKFAVVGYTEALYKELIAFNIKVTSINPGIVDTQMTSNSVIPNLEKIQPEDIANTVEYLLNLKTHTHVKEVNLECSEQVVSE